MNRRVNGYYTVEATFVVTICIWVLAALCFGGLYIHDRAVLSSTVNEMTAEWIEKEEVKKKDWVKTAKSQLNETLFLMQVNRVEAEKTLSVWNIRVRYELPGALTYLKKIWSEKVYETTREDVNPAVYKWDVDIWKE